MLKRGLVLIDARHGLKEVDHEMLEMLDNAAVGYHLVLTKADKVKPSALGTIYEGGGRSGEASRGAPRHLHDVERNR